MKFWLPPDDSLIYSTKEVRPPTHTSISSSSPCTNVKGEREEVELGMVLHNQNRGQHFCFSW